MGMAFYSQMNRCKCKCNTVKKKYIYINENQKWVTSNWTSWISVFCTCAHLPVSAGLSALSPWNDSPPSGSGSLSLNAPQSAPILTEKR